MPEETYDGLLLDHDGVLVELSATSVLRSAVTEAFTDVGVPEPHAEDVEALTVMVSPGTVPTVAARYDVDPDTLWDAREARIESTLRRATESGRKAPYDDVASLDDVDVPLGVVSNNQIEIVEFVLRAHGLYEQFGTVHAREPTRESLHTKKPEPTYLDAAAADLGCRNPLFVGDSESDVVAGNRAGFDTVFLRRDHNADRQLDADPLLEAGGLDAVVDLLPASE